MTRDAGI